MRKSILHTGALAAVLSAALALAACQAPGTSFSSSARESQSASQSAPSQSQTAPGSEKVEIPLYIGMGGTFTQYTAAVSSPVQPDDVVAAISALTGWDCTLARPVEQGDGFVKICFSQQSALFAGPPQVQKDEFHMYDANQMCLTLLDSVACTMQANFSGKDGQALDVYFVPEHENSDLMLEQAGLSIPQNEPYQVS